MGFQRQLWLLTKLIDTIVSGSPLSSHFYSHVNMVPVAKSERPCILWEISWDCERNPLGCGLLLHTVWIKMLKTIMYISEITFLFSVLDKSCSASVLLINVFMSMYLMHEVLVLAVQRCITIRKSTREGDSVRWKTIVLIELTCSPLLCAVLFPSSSTLPIPTVV